MIIAAERDRSRAAAGRQQGQVAVGLRVLRVRVSHSSRGEHPLAAGYRASRLLFPSVLGTRGGGRRAGKPMPVPSSSLLVASHPGEMMMMVMVVEARMGEAVEPGQVSGERGEGGSQVRRQ